MAYRRTTERTEARQAGDPRAHRRRRARPGGRGRLRLGRRAGRRRPRRRGRGHRLPPLPLQGRAVRRGLPRAPPSASWRWWPRWRRRRTRAVDERAGRRRRGVLPPRPGRPRAGLRPARRAGGPRRGERAPAAAPRLPRRVRRGARRGRRGRRAGAPRHRPRWPPRWSARSARPWWARWPPAPTAATTPWWPPSSSSAFQLPYRPKEPPHGARDRRHTPTHTHDVLNQAPPLAPYNVFEADAAAARGAGARGRRLGRRPPARHRRAGRLAPRRSSTPSAASATSRCCAPTTATATAWTRSSWTRPGTGCCARRIEREIHSLPWRDPQPGAHTVRAGLMYLWSQVNAGVMCPVSMTYSVIPALRENPDAGRASGSRAWCPRADYEARARSPAWR